MKEKKYELTENIKVLYNGRTLYQIRALKDFSDINAGDLGGYIEKESNLSQEGNCWICDEAMVFSNAEVFGNARIYDNARVFGDVEVYGNAVIYGNAKVYGNVRVFDHACVFGNAVIPNVNLYGYVRIFDTIYNDSKDSYICVGPIGSRKDNITAFLNKDKQIMIAIGCFKGTIEKFKEAVEEKHSNNKYGRQYKRFIKCVEEHFKDLLEEDNEKE